MTENRLWADCRACYTQEEIAERENLTQQAVALVSQEFADLQKLVKSHQSAAEHATDFEVKIGGHPTEPPICFPAGG